jgi:hypothetical protein
MPRSPTKKRQSDKPAHTHPSYKEMITAAIFDDAKWQKGSSRDSIKKYIVANYDIDEKALKVHLARALRTMKEDGPDGYPAIEQVKGSFKLSPEWKDEWKNGRKKSKSKKKKDSDDSDDDDDDDKKKKKRKSSSKKPKKKKRSAKKKRDPNLPKRPLSGFFLYLSDHRKAYRDRHPDLPVTDVTKRLSAKWRKLDKAELAKYQARADKEKKKYKKAMDEYNKNKSSSAESDSDDSSDDEKSTKKSKKESEEKTEEEESESDKKKRKKST